MPLISRRMLYANTITSSFWKGSAAWPPAPRGPTGRWGRAAGTASGTQVVVLVSVGHLPPATEMTPRSG